MLWKATKNTEETTNAETPNASGGEALRPPPPTPLQFFLILRLPPLNVVAVFVVVVVVAVAVVVADVVEGNQKAQEKQKM